MADIVGLGEALNSRIAEKVYDDAVLKASQQFGKFGEDFLKAARFALFPIQIVAAMQDRLEKMLERISNDVPPERRVTPPPLQMLGPIFENIKYMDDSSILYELFEELLACSIDSERFIDAHPSFIYIISQLSHDEAIMLFELRDNEFDVVDTMDLDREKNRFINRNIEKSTIPKGRLWFPDNVEMYYSHLDSLNLVMWPVIKEDIIKDKSNVQTGIRRYSKMHLTDFGKYFVKACIPESGFRNK